MTPLRLFRVVAIAETITWTMLITGLILRATLGLDVAVTIGGSIHGFVFLAYGAVAVLTAINQRWHPLVAVIAIATAVVPYATIPFELWAARTGRLAGDWRRTETDDPRDRFWVDRLARWMFRHSVVLTVLVAVAVVALFVVLVSVGPPVPKAG